MKFLREGRYELTTFVDPETKKTPVISTIFYMDGDVQHRVNEYEGEILAMKHKDMVSKHMQQMELNVNSMDILLTQLQSIITVTIAAIVFLKTSDLFSLKESLFMTAGATSITLLLKKRIAKFVFWILRMILKVYLRAFTKQWTG